MRNYSTRMKLCQVLAVAISVGVWATTGVFAFESPAFDRGCREMGHKDWDGAIVSFGEAIGFDQTNMKAYFKRGQCFYNMGNLSDAINDFSHIIDQDKNNVDAFLWRGTANSKLGKHDAAVRDYLTAIRLNPDLAKRYAEGNGAQAEESGEPRHAQVVSEGWGRRPEIQARARGPRVGQVENTGAVSDYKKAMTLFTGEKNTDELPTQANLSGNDAEQSTKDDSGPTERRRRGQEHRNRTGSRTRIAKSDHAQEMEQDPGLSKTEIRDRIAKLNSAVEADNRNPDLLYRRALLYERLENYDQSIADLGQAISLDPMDSRFYIARARVYHRTDQPDLEQADIAKARSVDPTVPAHIRFVNGKTTPQRENKEFKTPVE